MSRYQVKPREDGCGPYRWAHVVRSQCGELQAGTIYCQLGDELDQSERIALRAACDANGYEMRKIS